jgi:nitrogen fixation protein FixH
MTATTAPRDSRWIPWTFVIGFGLVFVVNGLLIWFAVSSFSGVAVEGPFDRGRTYNTVIAEAKRQADLGWRVEIALEGKRVVASVVDRDGAPVDLLAVEGRLVRPVERIADVPVALAGAGGGRYVGAVDLPKPGLWDAKLTFETRRSGQRLQTVTRVIAP